MKMSLRSEDIAEFSMLQKLEKFLKFFHHKSIKIIFLRLGGCAKIPVLFAAYDEFLGITSPMERNDLFVAPHQEIFFEITVVGAWYLHSSYIQLVYAAGHFLPPFFWLVFGRTGNFI